MPKDIFVLSHHPACHHYADEVFIIFGYRVCKGCTYFYISFLTSLLLLLMYNTAMPIQLWLIGTLFVIPSFFTFIHTPHNRLVKNWTRIFLGIAFACYLFPLTLFDNFIYKLLYLFGFTIVYSIYTYFRPKSHYCAVCDAGIYSN